MQLRCKIPKFGGSQCGGGFFYEAKQVFRAANRIYFQAGGGRCFHRGGSQKVGISEQIYYRWRNRYGGMMPSEMKRLNQLEERMCV